MNQPATLTLADMQATHVVKTWKYQSPLIACRFDPGGRYVYAAAQDNSLQRYRLVDEQVVPLAGHDSWVRSIGFSPDGKRLYTGGYEGRLIVWGVADDQVEETARADAHDGWIRALDVAPEGESIATVGNDRVVRLWQPKDGSGLEQRLELTGHKSHIYSAYFHPHEPYLLTGDLEGNVLQWELPSGKLVRQLEASALHTYNGGQGAHYGGVRSMSLSADGKSLACGGLHKASNPFGAVQEPLVVVLDWSTGKPSHTHEAEGVPKGIVWRVCYHPSGPLIGASGGGSGGFVLFWQGKEVKDVAKFKLPNTVLDMDLHPDGRQLVTAHYDRQIRVSAMSKP